MERSVAYFKTDLTSCCWLLQVLIVLSLQKKRKTCGGIFSFCYGSICVDFCFDNVRWKISMYGILFSCQMGNIKFLLTCRGPRLIIFPSRTSTPADMSIVSTLKCQKKCHNQITAINKLQSEWTFYNIAESHILHIIVPKSHLRTILTYFQTLNSESSLLWEYLTPPRSITGCW